MTILLTSSKIEMEFSRLDEKMELGSSSLAQTDDVDVDLDSTRQGSVDRSMADETDAMEDLADTILADVENGYNDDNMLDDEIMQLPSENADDIEDLNMDHFDDQGVLDADEEILYDDENEEGEEEEEEKQKTEREDASYAIQEQDLKDTEDIMVQIEDEDIQLDAVEGVQAHEQTEGYNPADIINTSQFSEKNEGSPKEPVVEPEAPRTQVYEEDGLATESDVVDFALGSRSEHNTQAPSEPGHQVVDQTTFTTHEHSSTLEQVDVDKHQRQPTSSETEEETRGVEASVQGTESTLPTGDRDESDDSTDGLHPVTVVYLGQEMSLFPPTDENSSATFFVSEPALADIPLDRLLGACRDVLEDSLEHDDELVLDIPALGLHIYEDSRYAPQLTFSQILGVYLSLSRNENITNPAPLYCILSTRVCLASQYGYLVSSAAEGKTYSEIAAEHIDSPEHDPVSFHEDVGEGFSTADAAVGDPELDTEDTGEHYQQRENHANPDASIHTAAISSETIGAVQRLGEDLGDKTSEVEPHASMPEGVEVETATAEPRTTRKSSLADPPLESGYDASVPPSGAFEDDQEEKIDLPDQTDDQSIRDENVEVSALEESASVSSHTVQSESAVGMHQQADTFVNESDNDALLHDDPSAYDLTEDLFREDEGNDLDESQEISTVSDASVVRDEETDDPQAPNDKDDSLNQDANPDLAQQSFALNDTDDERLEAQDLLQVEGSTISEPITPSKSNGSKRKAIEDDEELDFLDFSTPEPKRTRAT